MKAAAIKKYGGPEVFEITEVEKPVPKKNEVLIRVYASSVNPVDYKLRKGNWRFLLRGRFPLVLGYDAAGEVVKTGDNVKKFKPGDRVYCRLGRMFGGAYAVYAASAENTFSVIPGKLNYNEAAALPLAGVSALQALRDKGQISKEKKILINGASGGVGHYAVQLARILGGEVTAVASARHEAMMSELKPDDWIDYTKVDFLNLNEKYDIIFDVIGNKSFLQCKNTLNPGGIYITSLPRPKILYHKLLALFSGKKVKGFLMKSRASDLDYLSGLVEAGELKIWIDKTYPLEKISEAHKHSESGRAEGKIVIEIE